MFTIFKPKKPVAPVTIVAAPSSVEVALLPSEIVPIGESFASAAPEKYELVRSARGDSISLTACTEPGELDSDDDSVATALAPTVSSLSVSSTVPTKNATTPETMTPPVKRAVSLTHASSFEIEPVVSAVHNAAQMNTPTLPLLLQERIHGAMTTTYSVSKEDIIAAIKERKDHFLELLVGSEEFTTSAVQEMLWVRLNSLAQLRLSTHLEYTIRNKQKIIISDYLKGVGELGKINITYLNTILSKTYSDEEPDYTALAREIFEKYLNQFMESVEPGGLVQYNYTMLKEEDVRKKVENDLTIFLKEARRLFTVKYAESSTLDLGEEIRRLESASIKAKKAFDEANGKYEKTLLEIELFCEDRKVKKKSVGDLAVYFADNVPSSFKMALESRGIKPSQSDFKHNLIHIFMCSKLTHLHDCLQEAIRSGSPKSIRLLLKEFEIMKINPLEPAEKGIVSNELLCIFAELAAAAASAEALDEIATKLTLLLDALINIKYQEHIRAGSDEKLCAPRAKKYVLDALISRRGEKTVLELFLDANKIKILDKLKEYITDTMIDAAIQSDSTQFERKIYKALKAYETKIRRFEERSDLRPALIAKTEQFDFQNDLVDEFYNSLIQRRKALMTLMLSLWAANSTRTHSVLSNQMMACRAQCINYSEPDALILKRDELTPPLFLVLDKYVRGEFKNVRGPKAAKVGVVLREDALFESVSKDAPYTSICHYRPTIVHFSPHVPKSEMELSIALQNLLLSPISSYDKAFVPLERLTPAKNNLKGLPRRIYDNILDSFSHITSSNAICFLLHPFIYSAAKWELQRKHMSRMTEALVLIAQATPLKTYALQMKVVDHYLREGLRTMGADVDWLEPATSSLFMNTSHPAEKILEVVGDKVTVLAASATTEILVAKLKEEMNAWRAADKAEETKIRLEEQAVTAKRIQRLVEEIKVLKDERSTPLHGGKEVVSQGLFGLSSKEPVGGAGGPLPISRLG